MSKHAETTETTLTFSDAKAGGPTQQIPVARVVRVRPSQNGQRGVLALCPYCNHVHRHLWHRADETPGTRRSGCGRGRYELVVTPTQLAGGNR